MRIVTYNEVIKEIHKLFNLSEKLRAKIVLSRYKANHSKFFRWVYEYDFNYYQNIYNRIMYRYKVINNFKNNFGKFITGVTIQDYKSTHKLIDLLDRLKFIEMMDTLQIQIEDISVNFKDLKVHLK